MNVNNEKEQRTVSYADLAHRCYDQQLIIDNLNKHLCEAAKQDEIQLKKQFACLYCNGDISTKTVTIEYIKAADDIYELEVPLIHCPACGRLLTEGDFICQK